MVVKTQMIEEAGLAAIVEVVLEEVVDEVHNDFSRNIFASSSQFLLVSIFSIEANVSSSSVGLCIG